MTDELLEGFSDAAFDGIMGMGKNDASETGATALLTTMGVGAFGVCLGRESEDNGRLDLADSVSSLPSMDTSSATSLTAIGDYHWGLRLSGLGIKTSSGETYLSHMLLKVPNAWHMNMSDSWLGQKAPNTAASGRAAAAALRGSFAREGAPS